MFRGSPHPGDDALIRRYQADRGIEALKPGDERIVRHVEMCGSCGARYETLRAGLDEIGRLSFEAADAAFTADRLVHQRERILRRIDLHGARVLPFPASDHATPAPVLTRPILRWVAAAAAAGLLVGLSAGRMLHLTEESATTTAARRVTPPAPGTGRAMAVRTATLTAQDLDDVFLSDVELALSAPRTPELRAIDSLTLEVRDTLPVR